KAAVLFRVAKCPGKLHEQAPQLFRPEQWEQPFLELRYVGLVQNPVVSEAPVQLGCEKELRVTSYFSGPQPRDLRPKRLIKGSVNLDCIEKLRHALEAVKATRFTL